MAEYIEKEALIASFEEDIAAAESHPQSHFSRDGIAYLKYAASKIKSAPAANVREIGPIETNADRIRAMGDVELARWMAGQETAICDFIFGYLSKKTGMKFDTGEITTKLAEIEHGRLDRLKSPAEVEKRRSAPTAARI